jgi:hypothetical protein
MKRAIAPGAVVSLDDLYKQYGEKHGLEPGEEFITWLRTVKLKDHNKWQIFKEDETVYEETPVVKADKKEDVKPYDKAKEFVPPIVSTTNLSVSDVVGLSVRKARDVVPKISDIQLLKYAENEAKQRPNKDSLRNILLRRIKELSSGTMR